MIKWNVEKTVDDKIDLINSVSEVSSKINDSISRDFVLSKLSPQEKEYVIEMSNNAFLSRRILQTIKRKAKKWIWNVKTNDWEEVGLTEKEHKLLDGYLQHCFDSYMNRIYMINIINRNVPKNYLIEKITGIRDEEEKEETRMQSLIQQVKSKMEEKEG